jgi:glycosyltransferase involved in cell wall biosynthesis
VQFMKRIGILIVAYNAESTLAGVLDRIPEPTMSKVEEIFVFDDASQDETFRVGLSYAQEKSLSKLTVLRNEKNLGYGGNQKQGYQYAIRRGLDIVVLLHGDGQYAPEVMQRLLTPLEQDRADLVMGSRMMTPGGALRGRMPLYKYVGNRILSATQNWLIRTSFSEFHSGYRAYSVPAIAELPLHRLSESWHFDTQVILELLRRNRKIVEVPIPTYYGDEICYVDGVPYAMNCLRSTAAFALSTRRWPRVPAALRMGQQPSTSR